MRENLLKRRIRIRERIKDRIVVDWMVHNAKYFYCQALLGLKTISAPEGIMI
jgi:hypothetical protein